MKKRILALIMIVVMMFGLFGCGQASTQEGEKDIKDLEVKN